MIQLPSNPGLDNRFHISRNEGNDVDTLILNHGLDFTRNRTADQFIHSLIPQQPRLARRIHLIHVKATSPCLTTIPDFHDDYGTRGIKHRCDALVPYGNRHFHIHL